MQTLINRTPNPLKQYFALVVPLAFGIVCLFWPQTTIQKPSQLVPMLLCLENLALQLQALST